MSALIEYELVSGRKQELDELATGLQEMGLLPHLKKHPTLGKLFLCFNESQLLGPEEFRECINLEAPNPDEFEKTQTFKWFNEYINDNQEDASFPGGSRLKALLQFCTGYQVPPSGVSSSWHISISYLADDDDYQLPQAQACVSLLRLPVVHSQQKKFNEMMDIALKFESTGFGAV